MNYKPHPLIYAANEGFINTIRFAIEMNDAVDIDSLRYATEQVKCRYPYFSVRIDKENEDIVLAENTLPFVISESGDPLCLNSEESNYHLLAFAVKENVIYIDISHFICDGNGLFPMAKTLIYYYIENKYGADGIDTSGINLVTDEIKEEEYAYPYPDAPIEDNDALPIKPKEYDPFVFADDYFDDGGVYSYRLSVSQKDMMVYAKSNDGSPLSFIGVMMYKALMSLFPDTDKDVLFQVPHEYRAALGKPLSHECLARVMPVALSSKDVEKDVERLNTMVRGQIVIGSDEANDIEAINGMVQLGAYLQTLPLEGKKQMMIGVVGGTLEKNTFGISYTGRVSLDGMERYIHTIIAYAGENRFAGKIGTEIFCVGDHFSINLMQPGKNPAFKDAVVKAFKDCNISCELLGEGRYSLADMKL